MLIVQPCKTSAAYEAVPKKKLDLSLDKIEEKLKEKKHNILSKTNFLLITTYENMRITIYKSGKLMINGIKEKEAAQNIANYFVKQIYQL